jgi:predicted nucleotide-binding protein (sugar kinase/HSP70/actin superfamily)
MEDSERPICDICKRLKKDREIYTYHREKKKTYCNRCYITVLEYDIKDLKKIIEKYKRKQERKEWNEALDWYTPIK